MTVTRRSFAAGVPLAPPLSERDLMHATRQREPFDDDAWLYENKLDGFRCVAQTTAGGAVGLCSRTGKPFLSAFPDVAREVATLVRGDAVLDGELTVDDARGHQQFELLLRRARLSVPLRVREAVHEWPARFYVFDLLALNGRDLRGLPLLERKRLLRKLFDDSGTLIFVNGIHAQGCAVFEQIVALDLEGMVAKRLDSTYQRGCSRNWLKIKNPSYHRRAALGFGWHRKR
jgi:bifunctional non-homologous end joining protein LigD